MGAVTNKNINKRDAIGTLLIETAKFLTN